MQNQELSNLIRSKVDIVDIVSARMPLVKKGKNFFGVCPFHDDTSPSLCVSREKQIYTCFSCHATGNVYTFLMDYEHWNFKEALSYLGDIAGVDTKGIKIVKSDNRYDKFYDMYNLSLKYFQNNLLTKEGESARRYLKERFIDDKLIKEFEVGLSLSSRDDLTNLLQKKNYNIEDLNRIGLSRNNYDIYNDRIMFPLYDINGKVVGFSGRIYKNNDQNKYLNTQETVIFKKGECLYHYHIAKEQVRIDKNLIIMEGFMDVIRASSIGIRNTIALMGTALTNEQIKLIKRLSNNIILCLDGDNPGRKAAFNIGKIFSKEGIEVKIVTLPGDDDPDTFILNNGKDKFVSYLENAVNFNDYKLNVMRENVNFQSDEEKSQYINSVLEEVSNIDDDIRVEIILKKLAKEFDLRYNTLEKRLFSLKKGKPQKIQISIQNNIVHKDKYQQAIEQVIYFMLTNEWVITEVMREKLLVINENMRILVQEIIYYYKQYGRISIADFYTYLTDKEALLISLKDILNSGYVDTVTKDILYLYFKVIKEESKHMEIKRLEKKMLNEIDPLEQARIVEEIRKLRIGDNDNG